MCLGRREVGRPTVGDPRVYICMCVYICTTLNDFFGDPATTLGANTGGEYGGCGGVAQPMTRGAAKLQWFAQRPVNYRWYADGCSAGASDSAAQGDVGQGVRRARHAVDSGGGGDEAGATVGHLGGASRLNGLAEAGYMERRKVTGPHGYQLEFRITPIGEQHAKPVE
jgi:hypothetical protein